MDFDGSISIIGTGSLGASLAHALKNSGFRIHSLFNRTESKAAKLAKKMSVEISGGFPVAKDGLGDLIFLCVPDDQIPGTAQKLYAENLVDGKTLVHTSGTLPADALALPGSEKLAAFASAHPLQTFTPSKLASFKNITVSLNGDGPVCQQLSGIFKKLGAKTLRVSAEQKTRLHIAAVLVCNYMNALVKSAVEISGFSEMELKDMMMPLMEQTLQNIRDKNLADSLTGPIKRGDTGTVIRHLELLEKPEQKKIYALLGLYASKITEGEFPESVFREYF